MLPDASSLRKIHLLSPAGVIPRVMAPEPSLLPMLQLDSASAEPVLGGILNRPLIRDGLEKDYGLTLAMRRQLLEVPMRLRVEPQAQGPFQARLQIDLQLPYRDPEVRRALELTATRLERRGFPGDAGLIWFIRMVRPSTGRRSGWTMKRTLGACWGDGPGCPGKQGRGTRLCSAWCLPVHRHSNGRRTAHSVPTAASVPPVSEGSCDSRSAARELADRGAISGQVDVCARLR